MQLSEDVKTGDEEIVDQADNSLSDEQQARVEQLARVEAMAEELESRLAKLAAGADSLGNTGESELAASGTETPSRAFEYFITDSGGCVSVAVFGDSIGVFPYRRHLAIECDQPDDHPHRGRSNSASLAIKTGPCVAVDVPLSEQNTLAVEVLVNRLAGHLFGHFPQQAVTAIFHGGCWRIVVPRYETDERETVFEVVDAPDPALSYNRMGLDIDRRGLMVPVTAIYRLSEQGQRASVLAGGNGRRIQIVTGDIPAEALKRRYVRMSRAGGLFLLVGDFRKSQNDSEAKDVIYRTYGKSYKGLHRWFEGELVGTFDEPMTPVRLLDWVKAVEADRDRQREAALLELGALPLEQLYADTMDQEGKLKQEHRYGSLLGTSHGEYDSRYCFPFASQLAEVFPLLTVIAAESERRKHAINEQAAQAEAKLLSDFLKEHGTDAQIEQWDAGQLTVAEENALLVRLVYAPLETTFMTYRTLRLHEARQLCGPECVCKREGPTCTVRGTVAGKVEATAEEQEVIARVQQLLPGVAAHVSERTFNCDDPACHMVPMRHRRIQLDFKLGNRSFAHSLASPSGSKADGGPGSLVTVTCTWCEQGHVPVRSSVSERFVHPDTPVGRKMCSITAQLEAQAQEKV